MLELMGDGIHGTGGSADVLNGGISKIGLFLYAERKRASTISPAPLKQLSRAAARLLLSSYKLSGVGCASQGGARRVVAIQSFFGNAWAALGLACLLFSLVEALGVGQVGTAAGAAD